MKLLQLFIGDSKHIEVCSTCQIHQKSCMLLLDTGGFLMVISQANNLIICAFNFFPPMKSPNKRIFFFIWYLNKVINMQLSAREYLKVKC